MLIQYKKVLSLLIFRRGFLGWQEILSLVCISPAGVWAPSIFFFGPCVCIFTRQRGGSKSPGLGLPDHWGFLGPAIPEASLSEGGEGLVAQGKGTHSEDSQRRLLTLGRPGALDSSRVWNLRVLGGPRWGTGVGALPKPGLRAPRPRPHPDPRRAGSTATPCGRERQRWLACCFSLPSARKPD